MTHQHAPTSRLARGAVLFLALVLALGWLTPVATAASLAAPALQDGVTATVTGSLVNLRGGPGTGYGVVGRATEGVKGMSFREGDSLLAASVATAAPASSSGSSGAPE